MMHSFHPLSRLLRKALMAVALMGAASVSFIVSNPVLAADEAAAGPQEVMTKVANELLAALDAHRSEFRRDPGAVTPIVDKILLPRFDIDYTARVVLGKNARGATPEQVKRFVATFYTALLKTYSGALADFTADRLQILPFRGDAGADTATVSTTVRRDNGQVVRVDYSLRKTPTGWKAWDVVIEGVSYVRNYRNDLGTEIEQKGLESVITRLEKEGLNTRRATGF